MEDIIKKMDYYNTPCSSAAVGHQHFFTPGATPAYEETNKADDYDDDADDDDDDNQTLLLFPDTPAVQRDDDLEDFFPPQQQHAWFLEVLQEQQQQRHQSQEEEEEEEEESDSPYKTPSGIRRLRQEYIDAQEADDQASLDRLFLQSVADADNNAAVPTLPTLPDVSVSVTLPNGCVVTIGNVAAHLLPRYLQLINTGQF